MKEMTNEWFKAAKDDLDTIEEIIEEEHLTNIVAFHAQQVVEKCFKAILEEREIDVVKIHKLETLLRKLEDYIQFEIDLQLIKRLDEVYIESRYPGELGLLPNGKPSLDEANEFYQFAKDIFYNIKKLLS